MGLGFRVSGLAPFGGLVGVYTQGNEGTTRAFFGLGEVYKQGMM